MRSTVSHEAVPANDPRGRPARISYLVKRLERALRARLDVIMREEGLTTPQYTALTVLADHPGMPSAQLARHSFVSPQAAHEMVGTLQRKHWVERCEKNGNRREIELHLTAKGRALMARCDARVDALEAELTASLSPDEHASFRTLVKKCLAAL